MGKIRSIGLSLILITVFSAGLVGCGESSGSSGSGGGNDSGLDFPADTDTKLAEPTLENGQKVSEIVVNDHRDYNLFSVSSSNTQNIVLSMKKINDIVNDIRKRNLTKIDNYSLNKATENLEDCSYGGTIKFDASVTEPNVEEATITFDECYENYYDDGMYIDGKILVKVSQYNEEIDVYMRKDTTYLTDITFAETAKMLKGSEINTLGDEYYSTTEDGTTYYDPNKETMNFSVTTEVDGKKVAQKNAEYVFDLSSGAMYQTKGMVYINDLASYVTYDETYDMSNTPFVFYNDDRITSGKAIYNMANNGKVKIEVEEDGQVVTSVDNNGDGTYNLTDY
ncbi:MAG: hypothetical protein JJV95_02940 [Sulfurospirillum sp.]|nr:hypothetical protein [Sulfurospirillum sp.]